jgi:prophage regulatory protein
LATKKATYFPTLKLVSAGVCKMENNCIFLSVSKVANRYSVSSATVWRWVKENKLPKPVKLNGSTRWKIADLVAFEFEQEGRNS